MDEVILDLETSEIPATCDWLPTFAILKELLHANGGVLSSMALRKELERRLGIPNARPIVVELNFFDPEASRERGVPSPDFKFFHLGRSFYSEGKYQEAMNEVETAAQEKAEAASHSAYTTPSEEPPVAARTNRQEEARLVTYVKAALEEIYASDEHSGEKSYVFDVHSERKGSSFENVDIIAVHWRRLNVVELVTVEVKLEFNAVAVQQAVNYARFSNRTWIAVPVEADATEAAIELREWNVGLFEYVITRGVGILGCRRRQGRKYEVFPIHWPRRNQMDELESEEFLARYRAEFEKAGVLEPENRRAFPRVR